MNEGENTGMPTSPDFSSPNTSPDSQPIRPTVLPIYPAEPIASEQPAPEQPTAAAEEPAASSEPTPAEESAPVEPAADLPAEEPTQPAQTISSGDKQSLRNRFGFTRKFKNQQAPQRPAAPVFGNAPEYFNNAVQDIVIADAAAFDAKRKRKKIALIALAALVVLGAGLGVFFLIREANKPSVNRVQAAFNRYANYVLYGEEKDSDFGEYSATTSYTILDKYAYPDESYNKRLKELFDRFYSEYSAAVENGIYEKSDVIDSYKDDFALVIYSFDMDKAATLEAVLDKYISLGSSGLEEEISQKTEEYEKTNATLPVSFWYSAMSGYASLVGIYDSLGCIKNGAIDSTCHTENYSSVSGVRAQTNEYYEKYRGMIVSLRDSIYTNLWNVKGNI